MTDSDYQGILDRQSITERILDYARGVDRIDHDLICSVFHKDARLDYGTMFVGTGEEFADFIERVHPAMEAHSHHLSNIYITIDGDRAGSETYVVARLRSRGRDGCANDTVATGRYVDQWLRRNGEWRIIHRIYLHGVDSTQCGSEPGFPTTGTRDTSDPSYDALALRPRVED